MAEVHRITTELILGSIHNDVGDDGMMHAFFFEKPGVPSFGLGGMGTEIFYSKKGITLAALYARRHGPAYLRALSVSDIRSLLTNFVQENFWYISEEVFDDFSAGSYATKISQRTKTLLADKLEHSRIFKPEQKLSLFPLVTVRVSECFSSPVFFMRQPETLSNEIDPRLRPWLDGSTYPPLKETQAKKQYPASWLGVRSPNEKAAEKVKAAILGSAALTLTDTYRYMFSGREMWGGVCTMDNRPSFSFGNAHTPALMNDLLIRPEDNAWLSILSAKLLSDEPINQRQLRALEYFFRAWTLPPHERYPLHCMALEAVFGKRNNSTQAVKDGVRATLGSHIDESRIGDLLKIRGAVVHGQAPDVFDAEEYDTYYNTYSTDPISDLAILSAAALRQHVFDGAMTSQDEPHHEIVAKAKASGRIPKSFGTHQPDILAKPAKAAGSP